MTAIPAPARLPRARRVLAALAVAAAAALLAVGAAALAPGDDAPRSRTLVAPGGAFRLDYPAGWRAASPDELRSDPARPAALVRRGDGRGIVMVHAQPALDGTLASLGRQVERQVKRRLPDARGIAMRTIRLATGPALSYTFVRERSGIVQGIVAAPAGDRTYLIDTVAQGDAPDVAREAGAIVRSLRPGR